MISWAGCAFDGPRALTQWRPRSAEGVFVVCAQVEAPGPEPLFVPLYVGTFFEARQPGFPWQHPAAECWLRHAKSRRRLCVAEHHLPLASASRTDVVREALIRELRPVCNVLQPQWATSRPPSPVPGEGDRG